MTHRYLSAFSVLCFLTLILSSCSSDDAPPPSNNGLFLEVSSDVLRIGEGAKITGTYYSTGSSTDVTNQLRCTVANGNAVIANNNYVAGSTAGDDDLECVYFSESETIALTIEEGAPESAELVAEDTTLHVGAAYEYRYIGLYPDGEQVDYSAYSSWFSTNQSVASVDNGTVQGNQTGLAIIQASNTATGLPQGEVTVEVIPGVPQRIEVVQDELFYLGVSRTFRAKGFWDDGDEAFIRSATWSSSNDRAELVGSPQSGTFKAVSEGEVSISATLQGVTGTKDTEVTAAIVTSVRTAPPSQERLTSGAILEVRAYATFSDGSEVDVSGTADWRASRDVEFDTVPPSNQAFMTAINDSNTSTFFWADYDGVNGGLNQQFIYLDLPN